MESLRERADREETLSGLIKQDPSRTVKLGGEFSSEGHNQKKIKLRRRNENDSESRRRSRRVASDWRNGMNGTSRKKRERERV